MRFRLSIHQFLYLNLLDLNMLDEAAQFPVVFGKIMNIFGKFPRVIIMA